jgi:hypothetical protein
MARVKGFTTFEASTGFRGFLVPCLFRNFRAYVLESCVWGLHPIFGPSNTGAQHGFSRKTTHDASTEKVQEEHTH